jgi:hypothetical protein
MFSYGVFTSSALFKRAIIVHSRNGITQYRQLEQRRQRKRILLPTKYDLDEYFNLPWLTDHLSEDEINDEQLLELEQLKHVEDSFDQSRNRLSIS